MANTRRRRKAPITSSHRAPAKSSSSSKPQSTRTLIRKFHVLLKRKAQLLAASSNALEIAEIDEQIEKMGGLEAYQRMSAIGQGEDRGGGTEKVLIEWLKELGLGNLGTSRSEKGKSKAKLELLEVGALKHDNYSRHSSWINCTPIDLRSRHPSIREQDFLLLNVDENKEKWDVISLSLVLNFVPDARDRGRMLRLAHQFLRAASSFLFLVLPLPCIMNSRYIDLPNLHALLSCLGFKVVKERWKPGGKVAYWLLEKSIPEGKTEIWEKKRVVREGKTRNNFCILL